MRYFAKVSLVLAASLGMAGCQAAGSMADLQTVPMTPAGLRMSSAMPMAETTADNPPGFASFCLRFAAQCETMPDTPKVLTLDTSLAAKLVEINRGVNRQIWPVDDIKHYGRPEFWTIPTDGYGDCDDYAVTKRAQLIAAGIPANTLRLAVAITPRNIRHAVLTVATNQGDYLLDSLFDDVVPWNAPGYQWMMRQRADNARSWVSFQPNPPANIMTAAVQRNETAR